MRLCTSTNMIYKGLTPLLRLLVLGCVGACSVAPPKGWGVSSIALDTEGGRTLTDGVRLEFKEWNDENEVVQVKQAVLDFPTGALTEHDSTFEFMPRVYGFVEDTAVGTLNRSTDTANVSWGTGGPSNAAGLFSGGAAGMASFVLPNASDGLGAVWWYSASLERLFFVYDSGSGGNTISACVAGSDGTVGACKHATGPAGYFDWFGRTLADRPKVLVWDDERLVGLPLPCCVCTSVEYYSFSVGADGTPRLVVVDALNGRGPSLIQASAQTVWAASSGTTGDGDGTITISRYNYANAEASSVDLRLADIEAALALGLPAWALGVIVAASVLLALALAAVGVCVVRRRRRRPDESQLTSMEPEGAKSIAPTTKDAV